LEIIRGEDGRLIKVPDKKPLFRIKISRRVVLAGLFALFVWTLVGIAAWKFFAAWMSPGGLLAPRAPTLKNEGDYQSAQEGFRFHPPEAWGQTFASGKYPSGTTNQERKLVGYKKTTAGHPASFEVTYVDLPPSTDLGSYLVKTSPGLSPWSLAGAATPLTVGGVEANRFNLSTGNSPDLTMKEVVVFRRGERVYFFAGTFHSSDGESGQRIRRAVESVVW
jgi:hypothetical protein